MLSEDVNNMFFDVRFTTEKNKDAIAHIKGSQIAEKTLIANMMTKFSRLTESTKTTLAQEKREKVRYCDLDALKQEYLTMSTYTTEKVNMLGGRLTEFDLRANRLENHCFKQQEPIIILMKKNFNEIKTEIYYRLEKSHDELINLE